MYTTARHIVSEIIGKKMIDTAIDRFRDFDSSDDDDISPEDVARWLDLAAYAVHVSWIRSRSLPCKEYVIFALNGDMCLLLTSDPMGDVDKYTQPTGEGVKHD